MLDYFKFENRLKRLLGQYCKIKGIVNNNNKPPIIAVVGDKQKFELSVNYKGIMTDRRMKAEAEELKNFLEMDLLSVTMLDNTCNMAFESRDGEREALLDLAEDDYRFIPLSPYHLLIGYDPLNNLPIIANMKELPHLLIVGLAGTGKSSMLNYTLNNLKGAYTILCNAYTTDYNKINVNEEVTGEEDIISTLECLVSGTVTKDKPIYIIIEEMATLKNKKLLELINQILCVGRHLGKGVYVIGVCQESLKENFKYKSLFTNRVAFRQVDSYKAVLGRESEEVLKHREFLYLGNELIKGHTYTLNN